MEISRFATFNLYYQKGCRNDTSSAPDLSTACDDEERGVHQVTVYNDWILPSMMLSLVFTIFASNYSDLVGKKRKIFIVAALIGHMMGTLVPAIQSIFWQWSPHPASP